MTRQLALSVGRDATRIDDTDQVAGGVQHEGELLAIGSSGFETGMHLPHAPFPEPGHQLGGALGRVGKGRLKGLRIRQQRHRHGVFGHVDAEYRACHLSSLLSSIARCFTDVGSGSYASNHSGPYRLILAC